MMINEKLNHLESLKIELINLYKKVSARPITDQSPQKKKRKASPGPDNSFQQIVDLSIKVNREFSFFMTEIICNIHEGATEIEIKKLEEETLLVLNSFYKYHKSRLELSEYEDSGGLDYDYCIFHLDTDFVFYQLLSIEQLVKNCKCTYIFPLPFKSILV